MGVWVPVQNVEIQGRHVAPRCPKWGLPPCPCGDFAERCLSFRWVLLSIWASWCLWVSSTAASGLKVGHMFAWHRNKGALPCPEPCSEDWLMVYVPAGSWGPWLPPNPSEFGNESQCHNWRLYPALRPSDYPKRWHFLKKAGPVKGGKDKKVEVIEYKPAIILIGEVRDVISHPSALLALSMMACNLESTVLAG
jgi:hypothetical protein